jgi:hypothetical protein
VVFVTAERGDPDDRAERRAVEQGFRDHGVACTTLAFDAALAVAIRKGEPLSW